MSESDELRRLREADPAKATSVPSAEDPAARVLRERILMMDTEVRPARSRTLAIVAAAAVALATTTAVVLVTRGDPGAPGPPAPIDPGFAMCVETYSLESLENREVAFDGTITAVNGDEITFDVGEWFKGGSGGETTLEGAGTLGGLTSASSGIPLDAGTRLLVAGDGGFAWGCDFTQPYDASIAAAWRAALS